MWPRLYNSRGWWWAWLLRVARLCREPAAKRPRDGDVTGEESGMSDDLVVVEVRTYIRTEGDTVAVTVDNTCGYCTSSSCPLSPVFY